MIDKRSALYKLAQVYAARATRDVTGYKVTELREMAKKRKIAGYNNMSEAQLAKELGISFKTKAPTATAQSGAKKLSEIAKKHQQTKVEEIKAKRKPEKKATDARKQLAAIQKEYDTAMKELTQMKSRAVTHVKEVKKKQGNQAAEQLWREYAQTINRYHARFKEGVMKRAREVLYVENPSKMKARAVGTYDPNTQKITSNSVPKERMDTFKEGISEFRKLVGVPDLDDMKITVAAISDPTGLKDRSFYKRDTNQIHMASKAGVAVVIHETAHWLEEKSPEIHAKIEAFVEKRTRGEQYRRLKDITGLPYGDKELAKKDKFIDPYMGKKTGKGGSEILSMGLEYMYKDPLKFAKEDPEFFDFIYDLMRGR